MTEALPTHAAPAAKPLRRAATATSPVERAAIEKQVREEQYSLIFNSNRSSAPSSLLIALAFWAFLYWRLLDAQVLAWAVLMHGGQLARYLWVRRYLRWPQAAAANATWTRTYIGLVGLNGLTWGLAAWLFLPALDVLSVAFTVLVVLSVYSGGITWVAPVKAAVVAFSTPIMALLALTLFGQEELTYQVAGVLCLLYLYSSLKATLHYHQLLADALRARFENQGLTRRLEEQVQLVEEASREKSRFLAVASHDLRQPMHAMALFSAALERELAGQPQQLNAAHLQGAVRALSESLDTMLDISRLDAGVVPVHIQAVSLQRVFQSLNRTFAAQAEERGLQLRVRSTPLWVLSDARLLERMLSNLISNAMKYTGRGGVLVAARRIGKAIAVDVIDTGIGIAPDQQLRVFDEFYQVNNASRDRSLGLGIGLSIVRRLADLLDHGISLSSVPGRGSRFRVAMPPAAAGTSAPAFDGLQSGRFEARGGLPRRVLVLDDEVDILAGVCSLLRTYGIDVVTARTTDEALSALRTAPAPFDGFLCDIRLADNADGLDFALRLPALVPQAPPTLLITGETGPQPLQRVRDAGLPVLFKPVAAGPLLEALVAVRQAAHSRPAPLSPAP